MKVKLRPMHEQVVVLVGATSGIGLETALQMAEKGARLVIIGRSQEGLADAVEQVRIRSEHSRMVRGAILGRAGDAVPGAAFASVEAGGAPVATMTGEHVLALEGEVTDFESMRQAAEQVIQRFGRIDTWVNVVGVGEWALFEDTSPEEFRRIIDVNLVGQAYSAMAVLPYLRQQPHGSALIFVSSIAGRVPIPYQSAYSASKHGLLGMIDTLRLEMEYVGAPVSITAILPASINTPLFDKARTKLGVEPDPIPPIYEAQMVARAILHASTHPVTELIVGDAGYMMNFMKRVSPTLTHKMLGMMGFRKQRSNEPKSAQAPDNLYQHIGGFNTVEGEYGHVSKQFAPLTWLSTHPRARMAITAGLLAGVGALIGWRVMKARQRRQSWRYRLPRDARRLVKKTSKQAAIATGKARLAAGKALHSAGTTMAGMPVVSDLPMFHKPSLIERVGDTLGGFGAALLALLPFRRKKSLKDRISHQAHAIQERMPWQPHQPTLAERVAWKEQREKVRKGIDKAAEQVGKTSSRVANQIGDQRKEVVRAVDKMTERRKAKHPRANGPVIERREETEKVIIYRR
jgi:NAD(P)-dependent dehydrogenase (short-subunit alcohol dehydrogenase family)